MNIITLCRSKVLPAKHSSLLTHMLTFRFYLKNKCFLLLSTLTFHHCSKYNRKDKPPIATGSRGTEKLWYKIYLQCIRSVYYSFLDHSLILKLIKMSKTKSISAFERGMNQLFPVSIKNGPPPKGHPANLTQLWKALESTWASIPVESFDTLSILGTCS